MYDKRRDEHKATLQNDDHNERGRMISTSDIPVRIKPKHLTPMNTFTRNSGNGSTTYVMDLQSKFGGSDSFQVHSHDGTTWHQIPKGNSRQKGDQVPLSPRSNQSMTDKFWNK